MRASLGVQPVGEAPVSRCVATRRCLPIGLARRFPQATLKLAVALALLTLASPPLALAETYSVGVSKHIGFHEYAVGSITDMQTWWNDSPYFDVGFYANGAVNHTNNDTNLTSAWLSSVSA